MAIRVCFWEKSRHKEVQPHIDCLGLTLKEKREMEGVVEEEGQEEKRALAEPVLQVWEAKHRFAQ